MDEIAKKILKIENLPEGWLSKRKREEKEMYLYIKSRERKNKQMDYTETNKYIFFYGEIFSQWYSRDIVIDNIKYCTCEQFMMSEKARLFNDKDALEQIMKTSNPSIQKSWGKRVRNFNKKKWEEVCREIVYKGNYAKFTQHNDLKSQLLDTGDKIIVEASPYDRIWGIGLGENDKRCLDPNKWRGTNWLGKAIMKVRSKIREEKL